MLQVRGLTLQAILHSVISTVREQSFPVGRICAIPIQTLFKLRKLEQQWYNGTS